jgi:arylsulfatase A-like enzyme
MADLFKSGGYYTACVGKWHLGLEWQRKDAFDGAEYGIQAEVEAIRADPSKQKMQSFLLDCMDIDYDKPITHGPCNYGFDYFFGLSASLDQPPYTYIQNNRVLEKPDHISGVHPLDRSGPSQQQLWQRGPTAPGHNCRKVIPDMQAKVIDLIKNYRDGPFFIYYPTPAVHGPLLPDRKFEGKSGINVYADMVLMVDDMVGEITRTLKNAGIWEDTIFIFTSDNGCSGIADYPLLLSKGHNPSYVFRGRKSEIYEGGHRVPAIFSWPSRYDSPQTCDGMICLSDFFRTFADMLNVKIPDDAGEDSISLLGILEGREEHARDSIIHSSANGSFSIRLGNWKLELCDDNGCSGAWRIPEESTSEQVPYQLYDLNGDITERTNKAALYPELVQKLKEELKGAILKGRTTPGRQQRNAAEDDWPQAERLDIFEHQKTLNERSK